VTNSKVTSITLAPATLPQALPQREKEPWKLCRLPVAATPEETEVTATAKYQYHKKKKKDSQILQIGIGSQQIWT
jgi:hypothetical protein